jgi:citronellol/citronellal dehydrogenase
VLREEGVTDFSKYAAPGVETLAADFFVPDAVFDKTDTKVTRSGR